jgi:hypothetical protein
MGSQLLTSEREYVQVREFGNRPMLFIDVFEEPHAAKIVDPKNSEIRSADLLSSLKSSQSHWRSFSAVTTLAARCRPAGVDERSFRK